VRLPGQELARERLLVVEEASPPGGQALVADRRAGDGAQGLAAGAAGPVAGQDRHVVLHLGEEAPQAAPELPRPLVLGVLVAGGLDRKSTRLNSSHVK